MCDSHLAGINCHFDMHLERWDNLKVCWATILEASPNYVRYSVPQHFQETEEYNKWAKVEWKKTSRVTIDIFLN